MKKTPGGIKLLFLPVFMLSCFPVENSVILLIPSKTACTILLVLRGDPA